MTHLTIDTSIKPSWQRHNAVDRRHVYAHLLTIKKLPAFGRSLLAAGLYCIAHCVLADTDNPGIEL